MDAETRLEAVEAENERLRDELQMLKESLGLTFLAPLEMQLTGKETQLFGRLLKGGMVTKDSLMATLYHDTGKDEPEIKIVDVFVCKLRAKLRPFGIEIGTRWGLGYEMSPAMIAKFRAEWTQAKAA